MPEKDVIWKLESILSQPEIVRDLYKRVVCILLKLGIIDEEQKAILQVPGKVHENLTFQVVVSNNAFGAELGIMIKPDHSPRRTMSVRIIIGGKRIRFYENEDRGHRDDRRVFNGEIMNALKHIERALKRKLEELAAPV